MATSAPPLLHEDIRFTDKYIDVPVLRPGTQKQLVVKSVRQDNFAVGVRIWWHMRDMQGALQHGSDHSASSRCIPQLVQKSCEHVKSIS